MSRFGDSHGSSTATVAIAKAPKRPLWKRNFFTVLLTEASMSRLCRASLMGGLQSYFVSHPVTYLSVN